MAKLYSCTDPKHPNFLCFGSVSVTDVPENFDKLSLEEQEAIKADIKISKDLIAKLLKSSGFRTEERKWQNDL